MFNMRFQISKSRRHGNMTLLVSKLQRESTGCIKGNMIPHGNKNRPDVLVSSQCPSINFAVNNYIRIAPCVTLWFNVIGLLINSEI